MKNIRVKYYSALVNKEQASLGFVVNNKQYNLSFFQDKDLIYEIDHKKMIVHISSDTHKISFGALTKELLYYAVKTESIILFIGNKKSGIQFKYVYEAFLKDI